jgi:hypothetical protein
MTVEQWNAFADGEIDAGELRSQLLDDTAGEDNE